MTGFFIWSEYGIESSAQICAAKMLGRGFGGTRTRARVYSEHAAAEKDKVRFPFIRPKQRVGLRTGFLLR